MNFAAAMFGYGWLVIFFLVPRIAVAAEDPLFHSLHWAILFLMAMPYTIGGSIAGWIIYSRWRGNKKRNHPGRRDYRLRLIETPKERGR
jgi:hypothetical protein